MDTDIFAFFLFGFVSYLHGSNMIHLHIFFSIVPFALRQAYAWPHYENEYLNLESISQIP